jgi:hypothetical protein
MQSFFATGGSGASSKSLSFAAPALTQSSFNGKAIAINGSTITIVGDDAITTVDAHAQSIYSTNGGATWSTPATMGSALSGTTMSAVAVDSTSGNWMAVSASPGILSTTYGPWFSTSSNGTTWATPTIIGVTQNKNVIPEAICANPNSGIMVMVGAINNAPTEGCYALSGNEATWTSVSAMPSASPSATMLGVCVKDDGTQYVAVGLVGSAPGASYSANGSSWSVPQTVAGVASTGYFYACAYSPTLGLYVAVGSQHPSGNYYPAASYSSDGQTWSTATYMDPALATKGEMRSVCWCSTWGIFVAVGYAQPTLYPTYSYSSDGINWSVPQTMSATAISMYGVAFQNTGAGKVFAVGTTSARVTYYAVGTFS